MNAIPNAMDSMIAMSAFVRLLDIVPREAAPGRAVIEVTIAEMHSRSFGMAHGGLTATVLDTAMGFAARTLAPEGFETVTLQLNVNFIRPALIGDKLTVTGTARHNGKRTAVVQGEIVKGNNELVALASATMMYIPTPSS